MSNQYSKSILYYLPHPERSSNRRRHHHPPPFHDPLPSQWHRSWYPSSAHSSSAAGRSARLRRTRRWAVAAWSGSRRKTVAASRVRRRAPAARGEGAPLPNGFWNAATSSKIGVGLQRGGGGEVFAFSSRDCTIFTHCPQQPLNLLVQV